jgi:hypothetical protein
MAIRGRLLEAPIPGVVVVAVVLVALQGEPVVVV